MPHPLCFHTCLLWWFVFYCPTVTLSSSTNRVRQPWHKKCVVNDVIRRTRERIFLDLTGERFSFDDTSDLTPGQRKKTVEEPDTGDFGMYRRGYWLLIEGSSAGTCPRIRRYVLGSTSHSRIEGSDEHGSLVRPFERIRVVCRANCV